MNKYLKTLIIVLTLVFTFSLFGCTSDNGPATDEFTVTFVDFDGTVLKEVTCQVGDACDITPPADPDYFGYYDPTVSTNRYFSHWSLFESQYDSIDRDTEIKAIYPLSNILVHVFNRDVAFYAFFIIMGIVVALLLGLRESDRIGIKRDDLIDGFLWIVPVSILGARLWYVAFELDNFVYGGFFPSLLRIIGFQSGTLNFSSFGLSGLAIHGAFATAVVCAYFYTRKRKIDVFKVIDIVAVGFIIAQAFGRWGNFFNQEAHGGLIGGITDGAANLSLEQQYDFLKNTLHLPSFIVDNMYIKAGWKGYSVTPLSGFYHPTFFYESMINLVGFGLMLVLRRVKKIHFGELLSLYLVWYGGLRIFIETMRTDPLTFDFLGITFKSAIVTSTIMIILGILLSTFIRLKRKGMDYSTVPGYFGYKKPLEEEVVEQ